MNKYILSVILIISLLIYVNEESNEHLKLHYLDVGQGDSVLIQTPKKHNILIDGGNDRTLFSQVGQVLSMPYISLDIVVLTHPHADHINGLNLLIERFNPKIILYNKIEYKYVGYKEFLSLCESKRVCYDMQDLGYKRLDIEDGVKFELFIPDCKDSVENINNCSIITQLSYKGKKFLFMGDSEIEEEQWFLNTFSNHIGQIAILKAGHHCSRTSTSEEFLKKTKPYIVVCSCGKDNKFGHPHEEALRRIRNYTSKVWITSEQGTFSIRI